MESVDMNAALWGKKKKQLFHKRLFRFLLQENPEKKARGRSQRCRGQWKSYGKERD